MDQHYKSEKRVALALYIIDLVILISAFAALVTGFDLGQRGLLVLISAFALGSIAYYHVLFKAFLKKHNFSSFIQPLLNVGIVFVLIILTGGLPNPYFPVFFALLLALGIYLSYWSVAISATGIVMAAGQYIQTSETLEVGSIITSEILAFIVLFPISVFFGRQLSLLREEKKRASFLAEHMTQEKTRDEALLSSIADAVYAVDRERRIITWNEAAKLLTGFKSSEALGLRDYDLLDIRDTKGKKICPGNECPIDEAWATNNPVRRDDIYMLDKDRKTIALNYNAAPIRDDRNVVTGAVVIFQDITRKKEVDRMRNEFISVASHEMRTPIAAIEGYISLAQKIGEGQLTGKVAEYLKKAHTSVIFSANLLKNLLLVSKIDEDAVPINPIIFDLNEALDEVVTALAPAAENKGLKIEFQGSTISSEGRKVLSEPMKIRADKDRIKEVIANLIENAIKFTKEGSVTGTISGDNNFITLCIEDTGVGIPEVEIPKLFKKFYRVDNTFTREVGGTGLGLYIARSVIEKFGGKIWAESQMGKGSKFCFTLPRVN